MEDFMKQSNEVNEIIKALTIATGEISNPKNTAENPFFKSKYAPLGDILNMVRPILSKHGLIIIQNVSTDDRFVSIETGIYHTSGQYIISDKLQMSVEKATAQGQGSGITYGRRYQLSAFLNIASEDDDDANHVSSDKKETKKEEKQKGDLKGALKAISESKTIENLEKICKLIEARLWTDEESKELDFANSDKRSQLK
jgi:hypothetical protein